MAAKGWRMRKTVAPVVASLLQMIAYLWLRLIIWTYVTEHALRKPIPCFIVTYENLTQLSGYCLSFSGYLTSTNFPSELSPFAFTTQLQKLPDFVSWSITLNFYRRREKITKFLMQDRVYVRVKSKENLLYRHLNILFAINTIYLYPTTRSTNNEE